MKITVNGFSVQNQYKVELSQLIGWYNFIIRIRHAASYSKTKFISADNVKT